eukprot:scaffold363_cov331-Pavlova_lutheri.AAC.96
MSPGQLSSEQFPHHASASEHVHLSHGFPWPLAFGVWCEHLWCHPWYGSDASWFGCRRHADAPPRCWSPFFAREGFFQRTCASQVRQLCIQCSSGFVQGEHHVGGLDVAVRHAVLVQVRHASGHLHGQFRCVQLRPGVSDLGTQVSTSAVVGGEERCVGADVRTTCAHHVGMVRQACVQAHLPSKGRRVSFGCVAQECFDGHAMRCVGRGPFGRDAFVDHLSAKYVCEAATSEFFLPFQAELPQRTIQRIAGNLSLGIDSSSIVFRRAFGFASFLDFATSFASRFVSFRFVGLWEHPCEERFPLRPLPIVFLRLLGHLFLPSRGRRCAHAHPMRPCDSLGHAVPNAIAPLSFCLPPLLLPSVPFFFLLFCVSLVLTVLSLPVRTSFRSGCGSGRGKGGGGVGRVGQRGHSGTGTRRTLTQQPSKDADGKDGRIRWIVEQGMEKGTGPREDPGGIGTWRSEPTERMRETWRAWMQGKVEDKSQRKVLGRVGIGRRGRGADHRNARLPPGGHGRDGPRRGQERKPTTSGPGRRSERAPVSWKSSPRNILQQQGRAEGVPFGTGSGRTTCTATGSQRSERTRRTPTGGRNVHERTSMPLQAHGKLCDAKRTQCWRKMARLSRRRDRNCRAICIPCRERDVPRDGGRRRRVLGSPGSASTALATW